MAKPREASAETLRVVVETTGEPTMPGGNPDPRLVDLVRLLARQAARDFVHTAQEGQASDRPLP